MFMFILRLLLITFVVIPWYQVNNLDRMQRRYEDITQSTIESTFFVFNYCALRWCFWQVHPLQKDWEDDWIFEPQCDYLSCSFILMERTNYYETSTWVFYLCCHILRYRQMLTDRIWRQGEVVRLQKKSLTSYLDRRTVSAKRLRRLVFKLQSECTICLINYTEDDKVVKLTCDGRHIYHYECIKLWIKTREVCPICS